MLSIAVKQRWLIGFSPAIRDSMKLGLCHIMFGDDTLIYCEASVSQILFLRVILNAFEATSGLRINFSKSNLFPVNDVPNILMLADFFGCNIGTLPTTYLGLPLGVVFFYLYLGWNTRKINFPIGKDNIFRWEVN